ncbi:hypothetical protein BSKO_02571 [Bryopsis sp. KO-2023]|nr:hypothetical protein BSKO_02571 [Bryopsis sp. KO-2023]
MVSLPFPSLLKLPVPVKYEELQKEVFISLRPETFEGMRFEFVKPLNSQFMLTHSIFMGNIEIPTQGGPVYKCPVSAYEFGANIVANKMLMVGRMTSEGRMSGRIKFDVNDWMSLKWQAQLVNEPDVSQQMCDIDIKGSYFHGQLKVGSNGFFGANYLQSVTEKLSLGGEVFYMDEQRRSGLGFAARHVDENHIGAAQMANTGMLSLSYLQKIGDKASLAADFLYNSNMKEATTSIGYDYVFQRAHVRGKVDSNGVLSAFLEERLNAAVTFLLSGEVDHKKKDYKFGFGLQLGE